MHTTVFKFGEGSPYVNSRRPIGIEIQNRLLWQAMRLARTGKRIFKEGLVVYTPIPAYLSGPTILEVYWDFKSPDEYDVYSKTAS
ncbi:hypothetical protein CLV24_1206 [Pontibacter ummariensis]|uniref:Uncharacterized protein n=1 Tax=Pontibacter ummariensis TaxID=1610492 RepID=A0A239J2F0_9BACT|nr:hypothetical protein [Pontibacter ummariensis]PRY08842.1 hypothetical protein CLV24_1206 [Pontibacter ummariensis]SNS99852.1 hypothetical protein SAMN06296052_1205 [Pontibacter ummariensis]